MNNGAIIAIAGAKVMFSVNVDNKKGGFLWKPPFMLTYVNSP